MEDRVIGHVVVNVCHKYLSFALENFKEGALELDAKKNQNIR